MESDAARVPKSVKIILLVVVGAGIILVIFRSAASYLLSDLRIGSQASAVASLRKLNECATKYSSGHPRQGYPSSLALMGSKGGNCIDAQLEGGTKNRYKFTYTPAPGKEGEPSTAYTIYARPADFACTIFDVGCTGFSSFSTNESGVIHFTTEDRPANAKAPPLGGEGR
jgi:hypothetical protein